MGNYLMSDINPEELAKFLLRFRHDPLGWVQAMFPWGKGLLSDMDGPFPWQRAVLEELGKVRRDNPIRIAVASGHGIGKALALDTLVSTPRGARPIGDLTVGDLVWSPHGIPVKVKAIADWCCRPRYLIDLGLYEVIADGEHLWPTEVEGKGALRTTKEIAFHLKRGRKVIIPKVGSSKEVEVKSVSAFAPGATRCIEVSSVDGLFLLGSGVATHNSAISAWIILWAMSTFPQTRGVVTANTKVQLETKTFAELSRWFHLSPLPELFKLTATSLTFKDETYSKTWRCDIVPWSPHNPEAFAGLHNRGRRQFVLFDEASAIDDVIAETAAGAMTDENTERIWVQFGNPTRNTGFFRECFPPDGRFHRYWWTMRVDSREVPITDKEYIRQLSEAYGEDSDIFRVRVRGEFPLSNTLEFIPRALAREAAERSLDGIISDDVPVVMGVDIARGGQDETVVFVREGLNGRVGLYRWSFPDLVRTAEQIMTLIYKHRPDLVCVDAGGVGGGVVDILSRNGVGGLVPVNFGEKPLGLFPGVNCLNRRVEMWFAMREWLRNGGAIPNDDTLVEELCSIYQKISRSQKLADKLMLEGKEDVKARGGKSPDAADALALTFAMPEPIAQKTVATIRARDYNPIGRSLERELQEDY